MRVSVVLDDELLAKAMQASQLSSEQAVIEAVCARWSAPMRSSRFACCAANCTGKATSTLCGAQTTSRLHPYNTPIGSTSTRHPKGMSMPRKNAAGSGALIKICQR